MTPTEKAKVSVLVSRPVPLEHLKKYASAKPLRRPAPRLKGDQKTAGKTSDEAAFDNAMMQIYVRAKDEVGYNATRYLQMLHDHRGLETARILINAVNPSEVYTALWERGRLDLTVEALVLQPQWQAIFAQESELLQKARKRLGEYGYKG